MAKKFNIVYKVAKETAYANEAAAFVLGAAMNSVVEFSPVLAPGATVDAGAASAEYNIQRIKRIKGAAISNPMAGTTTAALAALDTFSKVEWESIGVATGVLRSVGVKVGINEQFDIDSLGAGHAKAIADSVNVELIERHEKLIEEAYTNAGIDGGTVAFTAGQTAVFDKLTAVANEIMLKSDEYKHMTDKANLVIVLHPSVADMVTKEIGTSFNQEAPIYKTGIGARTSINGIPVIVDANLNKYQATGATDRLGALIMDMEALAFKAANETKPIMVDLGLTKYVGKYFYSITKAIDTGRIAKIAFDATSLIATETAKVSA